MKVGAAIGECHYCGKQMTKESKSSARMCRQCRNKRRMNCNRSLRAQGPLPTPAKPQKPVPQTDPAAVARAHKLARGGKFSLVDALRFEGVI